MKNYLIYPGQVLKIPSSSVLQTHHLLMLHQPLTIKIYTLLGNVHGMCLIVAQAGLPISTYWSDAGIGLIMLASDGYIVNHTPTVGALCNRLLGIMAM